MADDEGPFMRSLAAALSLLLALPPAEAQEHPAFRRFGLAQGLPQSQVQVLLEDSRGFMWVGTFGGGLARLGASGFRVFGAAEGLQVRSVGALLEDRQGHIWVAGRDGGLSEIAGERILNHGTATGIPDPRVYALELDGEGRLVVGTGHGLYRLEGGRFAPVPLPGDWSRLPLFALARDGENRLWAITRKGRIIRWDGHDLQEERLPGPTGEELRDLRADPQGRIWALTEGRLYRRDGAGWKAEAMEGAPARPKMMGLAFSRTGEPLVAMGSDGVWFRSGGHGHLLGPKDGLPRDLIWTALWDSQGGLWVGSDGDGLAAHLVPGLWSYTAGDAPKGSELGAVMSFVEMGEGKYLLATNHGLDLFQEGKGIIRHWGSTQGLGSDSLWCAVPVKGQGVWIGSDRGLQLWRDGQLHPGPKALSLMAVTSIALHQGHLWAATDKGVAELDASGAYLRTISVPPEMGSAAVNEVISFGPDLVVGGFAGVMTLRDGKVAPMPPAELNRLMAGGMMVDRRGRLWIASSSGLTRKDGDAVMHLGTANGLLDENFTWAVDLGEDRLAGGHGRGVSIVGSDGVQHLTRNLGLVSDETNQNGVLLDSKGRLWIGMIGGFNRLDATQRFRNAPMRAPVVLEARWPGGFLALPQALDLPPQPEVVELRFDLGQPGLPASPRYQALLEGVDSDWRDVSPGNALQYLHLGRGRRLFRLRATVDGLRWVEAPPLPLNVRPAWHERWLVRGFLLLLLGGAVALVVRWRLGRLARMAEQLEAMVEDRTHMLDRQYKALAQAHEQIKRSLESRIRLVDMVTHDLRSPLTSITLAVDRLREEDDPETKAHMLGLLDQESRRIDDLIRGLLDRSRSEAALQSLNPAPVTPAEVLEGFQEVLRLKAEARGLHFHLDLPGEQFRTRVLADATALRQAILNLFENAVKFTPADGHVGLRSRVDDATMEWVLAVWDSGRGIPKDRQAEILQPFAQAHADDAEHGWGLGLSIVQALVEAHGGVLNLESEEGKGATFFIVLPILER
jgi:signal transduction histidine kinase/ligand-binding sensor domain-containing protein